jgi:hypothetical protein
MLLNAAELVLRKENRRRKMRESNYSQREEEAINTRRDYKSNSPHDGKHFILGIVLSNIRN